MGAISYSKIALLTFVIVFLAFLSSWLKTPEESTIILQQETQPQEQETPPEITSCLYNNIKIPAKTCVAHITNNLQDNPKYCIFSTLQQPNYQIIDNCQRCGCPSIEYICKRNGECIPA